MRCLARFRVVLGAILTSASVVSAAPAVAADASVAAMGAPIYQRVNPTTESSLVTPWLDEAASAATRYGYTIDRGMPFKASLVATSGLMGVRRLYQPTTTDFAWALQGSTALSALAAKGYVDQGVNFFASPVGIGAETQQVSTYLKGNRRRLAIASEGENLVAQGWAWEYAAFYVPIDAQAPPPGGGTSTPAGSLPVGSATYPAPIGAIYVASNGVDTSAGTLAAPVRSVARAIAMAPPGGTVVLRGGTYHESIVIASKPLTLQNYPGEAAWMDGSVPVAGWVADGTAWRHDGWTQRFDHSPTYTQGAPDSTVPNWQFVNTQTNPMAAYPDQVFLNGTAMRQVQTRAQVTSGYFYLDEATSRLYIGTDPRNQLIEASTLIKAATIRSSGVVIRGIGFRRFSPSVFHMGAITLEAPGVRVENLVVSDSATTALSVLRENATLNRLTIQRSGMLGVHGQYADNIVFSSVLATQNNSERFNVAPVSGGVKLGKSRGITVRDSSFSGNYGPGFWEDMSCYNSVIVNNEFTNNSGDGLFLEISAKAVVADNLFARNGLNGAKINNTSNVSMWNNTFVSEVRPVWLAQDGRRNTNSSDPAVDKRTAWPDPEMSWILGPVRFSNNVVSQSSSNSLVDVEDYSRTLSAEQMGIVLSGNAYYRSAFTSPTWLIIWSRGPSNPFTPTSLSQFKAATGQEATGREFAGTAILDGNSTLSKDLAAVESSIAQPLPPDVAALIGAPSGSLHLGRW